MPSNSYSPTRELSYKNVNSGDVLIGLVAAEQ